MAEELKPFQKVLVRDTEEKTWNASIFSHKDEEREVFCAAGVPWRQCISYEGNEHLLGTADSPNPPEEPFEFGDHVVVRDGKEESWCKALYLGTDASNNYAVALKGCRYVSLYKFCRHADW